MSRGRSAFQIAGGLDEDGNYLDGTGAQEAEFLSTCSWHARQRYEQLKAEWERWRYRRSRLPKDRRRPDIMRVGERECKHCGGFFEPRTLRQRYCRPTHRKLAHKSRP